LDRNLGDRYLSAGNTRKCDQFGAQTRLHKDCWQCCLLC